MSRPNLLYIHTDQHCPHVTGCYGDPIVETPNLDALAANGVVFDNVYCASPICVPSRMSMLSARHPHQNEVWSNMHGLDSSIPTHAHAMGAAGYEPTLIGRMHSVGPDQLHGYVERLVGDHGSNYIGGRGPERGALEGTAGPERTSLRISGAGQSSYQVHDEEVTAAAIDWLNRKGVEKRGLGELKPFSLSIGLMLPHPPYVARSEDFERYRDRVQLPEIRRSLAEETHPYLRRWREYTGNVDVTDQETLRSRAAYWGLVHRVDVMVGQILAALQENDLAHNTLIVYTSDHGDMLGEHGHWWKHLFYEQSARVPLIVSWPGVVNAGERCERVVSALDVTATMVDALEAPALPNSPGRSLLGLISDRRPTPQWEDVAFTEYCIDQFTPGNEARPGECYQRMIRRNEWKLIYDADAPPMLFNLAEDPQERIDRAGDAECAAILSDLTARILDGWDPDRIARRMAEKRADIPVLRDWAQKTQPPEVINWPMKAAMNYLDESDLEQ